MSALATLLGQTPASRILVLGLDDLVLEAALARPAGSEITRSADGRGVPRASADIVVMGRGAAAVASTRRSLVAAAARALIPGGVFAAEFPSRWAALSGPFLAYENVRTRTSGLGGLGYGAARRLVERAGFARVSGFICLPSLADPHVILPLESRPALVFHFEPPFYPESFPRRILRRCLGAAAAGGLMPLLAPSFGLLATRAGEPQLAEAA
jgi:hypothetical protein